MHGLENLILLKCQYYPKQSMNLYNLDPNLSGNFAEIGKAILKLMWNLKEPWIVQTILKKKNKFGGLTLPDFQIHYKATVIKMVWYWHKDRHIDNWNRIQSSEIDHCVYGQMIFKKNAKTSQRVKDSLINQRCWQKWITIRKRIQLGPNFILYTKINSKFYSFSSYS